MAGIDRIREQRGLMAKVAANLGITRAAVCQWRKIPSQHVRRVSEITGLPLHELRPDLYERPASEAA